MTNERQTIDTLFKPTYQTSEVKLRLELVSKIELVEHLLGQKIGTISDFQDLQDLVELTSKLAYSLTNRALAFA